MRVAAALVVLGACVDATPRLGEVSQASAVDDYLTTSCSTSVVLGLSQQIAEEVGCLVPGELVPFAQADNVVFTGAAVLPYLSEAGRDDLLAAAAAQPNTALRLTSVYRTVAQQYLLREWFERGRCGITAAAEPGNSNHESGRAIDVSNYGSWVAALAARDWDQNVPGDEVHFEHLTSADLRGTDVEAFQRLWNRNHADDLIDVDGAWGPMTAARMAMAPAEGFPVGADCGVVGERAVTLVDRTGPSELGPADRAVVTLTLANTGEVAWGAGTALVVGGDEPGALFAEGSWPSPTTMAVLPDEVLPGEQVEVPIEIEAPVRANREAVTDAFALDDAGVRFGSLALTVTVTPATDPTDPGEDPSCGGCDSGGSGAALLFLPTWVARRRRRGRPAR